MIATSSIDVAFFRDHGWWISESILSDDVLEQLEYGVRRYLAGEVDFRIPLPDVGDNNAPVSSRAQHDYVSLQVSEIKKFVHNPLLPSIAAQLMPSPEVRLFHDQLFTKFPGAGKTSIVGWHCDKAYWKACTSQDMVTAWIPLTDVAEDRSPLLVFDQSHNWTDVERLNLLDVRCLDWPPRKAPELAAKTPISLCPKRGQVIFHHCRLVHGSAANDSNVERIALAVHYQDKENRHVQLGAAQSTHLNDLLCRKDSFGLPDYTDPAICPRLW
jgi:ectoine hydroxylase-related dioxygenase (phytanoyl-CoA dioxygenase family)